MNNDRFESARNTVLSLLKLNSTGGNTLKHISEKVDLVLQFPEYALVDPVKLIQQIQDDRSIVTKDATELIGEDVWPWIKAEKSKIHWELWERYAHYLQEKNPNFPVAKLDKATDKILDHCMNPKRSGVWDHRGLVVGSVQSGKTANYTGLINKATDAGYKLIIVLAGMHNGLRSQTQMRIDEGFIGRDSSVRSRQRLTKTIGVGERAVGEEIHSYTSSEVHGDFNASREGLNVPIGGSTKSVVVIKKNKSILENLILWLNGFATEVDGGRLILDTPLLVIDDEADNASVNAGTDTEVRTINRLIRVLLGMFSQNAYVGYTATPYANLFIPETWREDTMTTIKEIDFKVGEDLFPRSFILNLPSPSNYIGAKKVFGIDDPNSEESSEGLNVIRAVTDRDPLLPAKINKDNEDDLPDRLPDSLKQAVKSFIVTNAIRHLRGQGQQHSSMLVHVALRVKWIDRVALLVDELVQEFRNGIKYKDPIILDELFELFETDYVPTTESVNANKGYEDSQIQVHNWEEVEVYLLAAVSKMEVRAVHGQKKLATLEYHEIEELNYDLYKDSGLCVIAVGGNKLARGITLEGLSISYYLRTSKMYDSLMQMGRWFGYRPGYVDLCRLYTTNELRHWFRHVTMANEELRADFDELARKRMKPADFQLKVRTHPGMLKITSLAKMRGHEKIKVGFSGHLTQTHEFRAQDVAPNHDALNVLLSRISEARRVMQKGNAKKVAAWQFENVQVEHVLEFLSAYQDENRSYPTQQGYIKTQNTNNLLKDWSVVIYNTPSAKIEIPFTIDGREEQIGIGERSFELIGQDKFIVGEKKNAILFREHLVVDLDGVNRNSSMTNIKKARMQTGKPLLVIVPLRSKGEQGDFSPELPCVGFGLHFPIIKGEQHFEYAARPIAEFEEVLQESDDPEDEE